MHAGSGMVVENGFDDRVVLILFLGNSCSIPHTYSVLQNTREHYVIPSSFPFFKESLRFGLSRVRVVADQGTIPEPTPPVATRGKRETGRGGGGAVLDAAAECRRVEGRRPHGGRVVVGPLPLLQCSKGEGVSRGRREGGTESALCGTLSDDAGRRKQM